MTTPGPTKVVLSPDVLVSVAGHVDHDDPLETGGVLLGHRATATFHVTVAGGPGPWAVRRPNYFLRDLDHARTLAAAAWETDRSQWIGEWHTHPRGPARPSPLDLRTYRRLLTDPELGFDAFLSLVVTPAGLTAWAVARHSRAGPVRLDVRT